MATRPRLLAAALLAAMIAAALLVAIPLLRPAPPAGEAVRASLTVAAALGGDTAGFRRVLGPRPFIFPGDHGPHAGFRTEWWYFTGNLTDAAGRRFGYQLTLFRNALTPDTAAPAMPATPDDWATNEIYMGHLAVTDAAGRRFFGFERFARAAASLAGATIPPLRVWLEDWEIQGDVATAAGGSNGVAGMDRGSAQDGGVARVTGAAGVAGAAGLFPARLRAFEEGVGIDLLLTAGKPIVLQGDAGYSRKGQAPGNASHYYSFTRIPSAGTIVIGADTFRVAGLSWLDREWSTSALDEGQVGWDWFALQLDDGSDIMLYQLRRADGSADTLSRGTLVAADGTARGITFDALALDTLGGWTSPRGGRYPARWRLRIPGEALDIEIVPLLADQEHDAYVRYWEGAVDVRGSRRGAPIAGRGYVELTGYAADARRSPQEP
jgi:predicted secreted hydrolase